MARSDAQALLVRRVDIPTGLVAQPAGTRPPTRGALPGHPGRGGTSAQPPPPHAKSHWGRIAAMQAKPHGSSALQNGSSI